MKRLVFLSTLLGTLALADVAPAEPAPAAQVATAEAPPAAEAAPAPTPMHPVGIEKAMPSGVIEGGWSYVFAAYGLAYVGLVVYALSLVLRRQKPGVPS